MAKVQDAFNALISAVRRTQANNEDSVVNENEISGRSSGDDIENDIVRSEESTAARFEYKPNTFLSRVVLGMGIKSKLAASRNVTIDYNVRLKWWLVAIVALLTVFLTPNLLPNWIGYKWSEPSDLCKEPIVKLKRIRDKMESLSKITDGARFIEQAERAVQCAENSAKAAWTGPPNRIRYPDQCIPDLAKVKTRSHSECVPERPVRRRVCASSIIRINGLTCKTEAVNPVCTTVTIPDAASQQRVEELKARREARLREEAFIEVHYNFSVVANTADEKAQNVIRRLVWQTDVASNLFILYSMLAIIIGAPLVIYKRDLKTIATKRSLALRRTQFMALVVLALVVYDYCESLLRDVNFPRLFRDFSNDPCYLDPSFAQKRLQLISDTCGNVTTQRAKLDATLTRLSQITFDAELCEVCGFGAIAPHPDEVLVSNLKEELNKYNDGIHPGYAYPGVCNTSVLDSETNSPPESGISFARAFFGSGVIAQLFLKGILVSFLIHGCAYLFDAMVLHKGEVEMFGIAEDNQGGLSLDEEGSVRRFARDKHLLAFIIVSVLMVWEAVVIVYSIYESNRKSGSLLTEVTLSDEENIAWVYSCPNLRGILQSINRTID